MKTFFSLVLGFLFCLQLQATSNDPKAFILSTSGSNSLILSIEKPLSEATHLAIFDQKGQVLHQEVLPKGSVNSKLFQLQALPNGQYNIQLTSSLYIDRYPFQVEEKGLLLNEAAITRLNRPVLTSKGGITNLSFLNEGKRKVVVTLQDELGQEVYTETVAGELQVTRRYNFRQLPKGNYQLVVSTGQDRVVHSLAL